jgi:hypothetical protein
MKSLWGMIKARRTPFRHRYLLRVFHPDAFSREVPADDLPGNLEFSTACSTDLSNQSLAVLEVMVAGNVTSCDAAAILRHIAAAIEQSPNGFHDWVGKHYDVTQHAFVDHAPLYQRKRKR